MSSDTVSPLLVVDRPVHEGIGASGASGVSPTIGVFDSGIGGLSIGRELRMQLPSTSLHYVADSAYAPYGERGDDYVVRRSLRIAHHLVSRGAVVVVVACNTATAAAVQTLRSTWPELKVVGVEPGIKPALLATRNGRIGVLATPGTLASDKFRRLMADQAARHGDAQVVLQPCPGLAALIERGDFKAPDIEAAVHAFCRPLREAEVDTVVLGCTHYAFIRKIIEVEMGAGVALVDTAAAVARQAAALFSAIPADPGGCSPDPATSLKIETTGDPEFVRPIVRTVTGLDAEVVGVQLD